MLQSKKSLWLSSLKNSKIFCQRLKRTGKMPKKINDRILLHSKITDTTEIRLKAKENKFSINYKPFNFIHPKKNKVKYIIEPYQKKWITSLNPNHKQTFTNFHKSNNRYQVFTGFYLYHRKVLALESLKPFLISVLLLLNVFQKL